MWWPSNLVQVSLFMAFHEKEKRPKGENTRSNVRFILPRDILSIDTTDVYFKPAC